MYVYFTNFGSKNEMVYDLRLQIQVQKQLTGNRIHICLCMALSGEDAFRIGKANLSRTNRIRLWRHVVDCSCVGNWVERPSVGRVAWFLFACFSFLWIWWSASMCTFFVFGVFVTPFVSESMIVVSRAEIGQLCVCVCVCMCVCVRACVRACVCVHYTFVWERKWCCL